MFKKPGLILIALFVCLQLFSTIHTIGSGTTTQYNQPFNALMNYGWSKAIYRPTELADTGLVSGTAIYGLGFEISSSANLYQLQNQRIYLKNTGQSSYSSSEPYPNLQDYTLVFASDLAISAPGWFYVCWDQPFIYTGQRLEVVWENRSGSRLSTAPFFTSTNTGQNICAYASSNTAFPSGNGSAQYSRANLRLISSSPDLPLPAQFIQPLSNNTMINPVKLAWHSPSGQQSSWDVYLGTASPPPLLGNQISNLLDIELEPATTYFWKIVPRNITGEASDSAIWSFRTTAPNQVAESFESILFPPPDWLCDPGISLDTTGKAYHGNAAVFTQATSTPRRLVSPPLAIDETSFVQFWAMPSAITGNGRIKLSVSTGEDTWQELAVFTMPTSSIWTCFSAGSEFFTGAHGEARIALDFYSVGATTGMYLDHLVGPRLAGTLDTPQNPQIQRTPTEIVLRWNPVQGAGSYLIESTTDPSLQNWEELTECESTEYRFPAPVVREAFYRIIAKQ